MKSPTQFWPPPDEERGGQAKLGAPENANNPSRIDSTNDTPITAQWQRRSRAHIEFLLTALSLDCIGAPRAGLSLRRELADLAEGPG